jgi:RsiW-degrading membrane proteinase PrsW (M82 family)
MGKILVEYRKLKAVQVSNCNRRFTMNLLFITIPASIIPSILLVLYFCRKDHFSQPPNKILTIFLLGILITIPICIIELPYYLLVRHLKSPLFYGFCRALFCAALPEETLKMFVLTWYATRKLRFKNKMDGIVYGATVSLGFATLENYSWVHFGGIHVAIARALTAVPEHAFLGVLMGYFLYIYLIKSRNKYLYFAWFIPVLFHTIYDFPLLFISKIVSDKILVYPPDIYSLLFGFYLYIAFFFVFVFRFVIKVSKEKEDDLIDEILVGVVIPKDKST